MKSVEGGRKEIRYSDKWRGDRIHPNDLYNTEDDYGDDALPYLRSHISNTKQNNPPQQWTVGLLLNLLLGNLFPQGGATTKPPVTTTTTTTTEEPLPTETTAMTMTMSKRTRRTTKYPKHGNCKSGGPKEHDTGDYGDRHYDNEDQEYQDK